MSNNKKQDEKENRRYLYEHNREAYKQERKKFVRGVSKTFRNLLENRKDEISYLEEQTKSACDLEENGEKE